MQNVSKLGKTIILKDTMCAPPAWCMEAQPFLPPPPLTSTEDLAGSVEYSLYSAMHSHMRDWILWPHCYNKAVPHLITIMLLCLTSVGQILSRCEWSHRNLPYLRI